ncbi:MAG: shikimate kinase AroK, partial [Oxalobacter sp.]|nr:shikimate kinase AroK [Oxalobacter sp.]
MQQNIFLVGLMGAGKTTVGRLLAKRLGMRFVDSDHEIEARTGATISWIFEIEGEESFRRREVETIRDLTGRSGVVLATGGGAVIHPENRKHLKDRGTVIYLRASVNNILQRTMHDKSRPLLQTENRKEKLEELARQRDPLYREVADIIVDTGRPNVHAMVQSIMAQLANYQKGQTARKQKKQPANRTKKVQTIMKNSDTHLEVDLGERSYPIEIGADLLTDTALLGRLISGKRIVIITNTVVAPLYLETLTRSLETAGKTVQSLVLPDGEKEKNWTSLMKIFDFLMEHK